MISSAPPVVALVLPEVLVDELGPLPPLCPAPGSHESSHTGITGGRSSSSAQPAWPASTNNKTGMRRMCTASLRPQPATNQFLAPERLVPVRDAELPVA